MGPCTTLYQVSVVNTFTFPHFITSFALSCFITSVTSSKGSRAERFSLNPTSGELRAAAPLRWAERAEYTFDVTAADHGTPGLSSTCQIRIQVNLLSAFVASQKLL